MNKAKRLINTLSARLAAMSLVAAALLATATGLGCLTSRTGGAPRGYSVAVLGDVHYDAPYDLKSSKYWAPLDGKYKHVDGPVDAEYKSSGKMLFPRM